MDSHDEKQPMHHLTNAKLKDISATVTRLINTSNQHSQNALTARSLQLDRKRKEIKALELTEDELTNRCEAAHLKLAHIQTEFNEKSEQMRIKTEGLFFPRARN